MTVDSKTRSTRAVVAACVLIVVFVSDSRAGVASAGGRSMVALGDSYASGLGTRTYFASAGACKRSPYAYPVLAARRLGATLAFAACADATTATVRHHQLGTLARSTTDVTLTVGGNDAGFRSVVITCAQPSWLTDCDGAVRSARHYIRRRLPARLNRLYAAVRSRASSASVVVAGYPRLFNGEDCNAGTWFSPEEQSNLNVTADTLDAVIRRRTRAYGFAFVDPRKAFTGHAVCAEVEWLNGLSSPLSESYHPNRVGQSRYARAVYRRLN